MRQVRQCFEYFGLIHAERFVESFPLEDTSPGREPDFFGVYETLPDGTQRHVRDFPTLAEAEAFAAEV